LQHAGRRTVRNCIELARCGPTSRSSRRRPPEGPGPPSELSGSCDRHQPASSPSGVNPSQSAGARPGLALPGRAGSLCAGGSHHSQSLGARPSNRVLSGRRPIGFACHRARVRRDICHTHVSRRLFSALVRPPSWGISAQLDLAPSRSSHAHKAQLDSLASPTGQAGAAHSCSRLDDGNRDGGLGGRPGPATTRNACDLKSGRDCNGA